MTRYRKKRKRQVRFVVILSTFTLLFIATGYAAISTNITLKAKGNILKEKTGEAIASTLGTTDSEKNAKGLYQDATEPGRYIFKGSNPQNYISFNGETWRIYSIEEDGSIKIVKDYDKSVRIPSPTNFDAINARPTESNSYCDSSSSDGCNAWAANTNLTEKPSYFINESKSGEVNVDSKMLTYLNSDTSGNYYNSLSTEAKSQIISHVWNVGPAGVYNDSYTVSKLVSSDFEGKYHWSGKVALLTKSEYMRASSNSSCITANSWYGAYATGNKKCVDTDYLYNSSTSWWLLSPPSNNSTNVLYAGAGGDIYSTAAKSWIGVRPAVYLCSDLTISGEGTNDDKIFKVSGICS